MNHISIFTTNSIVTDKKVPIIFSLRIFFHNKLFFSTLLVLVSVNC